jgi:ribosomal protein S10
MDIYHCVCGKDIKYSSVSIHFKTAYHKRIIELKKDNDNLLNRILNERVEKINLEFELDQLKKKYCNK